MPRKTLDLNFVVSPQNLAKQIGEQWDSWRRSRTGKEQQWAELRNYVFATDTTTTSNSSLPWKNKTTRPKLCQIRDNLHANYMAALLPNDNWFKWVPSDVEAATAEKRNAIVAYMRTKLRECKFKQFVAQAIYDYIDYGNAIADVEYVTETWQNKNGETVTGYVGPRPVRVSPFDIVFDPTSQSFEHTPKIFRSLVSLGTLEQKRKIDPAYMGIDDAMMTKIRENRMTVFSYRPEDIKKTEGLAVDGFGSIYDYYKSGLVELIEFEGDLYDRETGVVYTNHVIGMVDRAYIFRNEPMDSWTGRSTKQHVAWRMRPDNLWGMGPLDNLVGLQYRVDHLENLKADVFDMIAHPVMKVRGMVEEFNYGPGERIFVGEEGDVDFMRPDTTALNADMQIAILLQEMEEMAGAPKQAMGIRTPGEKTAYEVQTLDNAAGRMFQQKIAYFEEHFLEPILNSMLEIARRNLDATDLAGIVDPDYGIVEFLRISKEDLKARGKLIPMGARHFASQAQLVQNMTNLVSSGMWTDPGIRSHISGKKLARLGIEALNLSEYGVYQEGIGIIEQMELQSLQTTAEQQNQMMAMTPTDTLEEDLAGLEEEAETDQEQPVQ